MVPALLINRKAGENMEIVCLGDSLTEGYGVRREECWVSLSRARLGHWWHNAGVSGDTSLGMLVRLQTRVLQLKPDMVIWLGGYNDILMTASSAQAKSCVMSFLNQCTQSGAKPVIGIPYMVTDIPRPWSQVCDRERGMEALREYISWLRDLTRAASLRCVDFEPVANHLQWDGMHPNVRGHQIMADRVVASGLFGEAPR